MTIIALLLCYFLGAIPFGVLIGRVCGVDVRAVGSGNSGATNVWRALGPKAGAAVFALDVGKGMAAPFIGKALLGSEEFLFIALCAALAVLGHTFSVFLRFRGGKGIATGVGAAFVLMPLPALLCFALWGVVLLLTRMISAASLASSIALPLSGWALGEHREAVGVIAILCAVAVVKHLPNLRRIVGGHEPKIQIGKAKTSAAAASPSLSSPCRVLPKR